MNLGASLLERDFVHRQLHEMNAASVIRFEVFHSHGIRNGARIEPLTRDAALAYAAELTREGTVDLPLEIKA